MSRWRDAKQKRVQKGKNSKKAIEEKSLEFAQSASLSSRLKAFLLDTFLITTPILYIIIYLVIGSGEEFASNRALGWLYIFAIHITIILLFWLIKSQTPGLRAYELKLLDSKTNEKIGLFQAIVRYLLTTISIVSILLIFTPFFRKDKKTFQDLLSNSYISQI